MSRACRHMASGMRIKAQFRACLRAHAHGETPFRVKPSAILGESAIACAMSAWPSGAFRLRSLSIPRP